MIAIKINNTKEFMAKLLTTEAFDNFYVEEAIIDTFNTFTIDGRVNSEYYSGDSETSPESLKEYSLWSELRGFVLSLIKGKRTPSGIKLIFHLDDDRKAALVKEADASIDPDRIKLGINIKFSAGEVTITTGTAYNLFTLDKSIEKAWDTNFPSFMDHVSINYEIIS